MKEWFQLASGTAVVKRALICVVIVGAVLISINHGSAIVHGEITSGRLVQMGLTLLVPYFVSTFSSVAAMRAARGVNTEDDQRLPP